MELDDIRKLKGLQAENQALKQMVADEAQLIEARVKPLLRWRIQAQSMSVRGYHKARRRFASTRER